MKIKSLLKAIITLLVISIWCSEFLNYSVVGQVKAQNSPDPEEVFEEYMETFDREQTILEKESGKQKTRESIVEDIVIEAEMNNPGPTEVQPLTVP